MESIDISLDTIKKKISEVQRFLSISLSIANAHTVDFYTREVWDEFMAVRPENVLSEINSSCAHTRAPEGKEKNTFGFCAESKRLVDVGALLEAAKAHSLPGLGVCVPRADILQTLRETEGQTLLQKGVTSDGVVEPDGFMNCKKAHEVQAMSEVVASLANHCRVQQVIDVGSGKGYLCSYLSLQFGLQVFGIDSSSTNTHGAQERNRKLRKFSRAYQRHRRNQEVPPPGGEEEERAYQRHGQAANNQEVPPPGGEEEERGVREEGGEEREKRSHRVQRGGTEEEEEDRVTTPVDDQPPSQRLGDGGAADPADPDPEDPFLGALLPDVVEPPSPRAPPSTLSQAERERRKRENLQRKAHSGSSSLFSPLTSYITAETELREIVTELQDAVMVGLHTCGDLAPSMLRMFCAKRELRAVCSVGCCYHLLSEEFDPARQEAASGTCGFPVSGYLREQACFCGRNARMSACLALERVTVGGGLPMESLFYRAVLHVILKEHYEAHKSEKRVGNVYSKSSSFVDYVRRALRKLELDESKLHDNLIQSYHDRYSPRMCEMVAFNMLKVTLAPCIEGLILLDRLCYLKEQGNVAFSALVQLFDPLTSPRCYGVIGLKAPGMA